MAPNSLKLTQKSSEKKRQVISFKPASTTKKAIQRRVRMRQPSSFRLSALPNSTLRKLRPSSIPAVSPPANSRLTIVGLTLMKNESSSARVSPPNTSTKAPPTSGITGRRFSRYQFSGSAIAVATMNAPVPVISP